MRPLLVIVGPTGSGKTSLAIELAERAGAEIVSADSQQVYRGMDIGTGKASAEEQARVPHHLLDVVDPDEDMTAARFAELADESIAALSAADRPIVIAGGTMLYVRALLRGLFEGPAADEEIRDELRAQAAAEGVASLWRTLQLVDAESCERIHDTDERRLIRAIEVHRLTGLPLSEHHRRHQLQPPRYRARLIGLAPERQELYRRIDARVLGMIEAGWLDELRALRARGYGRELRSQRAIGYCELHAHLEGERSLEATIDLIKRNSRRYARRQLSWYRGDSQVEWLEDPSSVDLSRLEGYLVAQHL